MFQRKQPHQIAKSPVVNFANFFTTDPRSVQTIEIVVKVYTKRSMLEKGSVSYGFYKLLDFGVEGSPLAADSPEDVGRDEEDVDADDDVRNELVGQLGDQLVAVGDVVLLALQLRHVFSEQAAHQEVRQRLEDGPEIRGSML
jgi:hypothetical protein